MNKAQKTRLAELERQKKELKDYRDEYRKEFGLTGDEKLVITKGVLEDLRNTLSGPPADLIDDTLTVIQ